MQMIILVCMFIQMCGTYFIWPSRWNIQAHLSLSLFVAAFAVPCLFIDATSTYPEAVISTCVQILVIGSITYMAGLFIGNALFQSITKLRLAPAPFQFDALSDQITTRSFRWMAIGCVLVIIAFAGMGYVPAFAQNALEAKFFRGTYAASYQRVQIFYRAGIQIVALLIPLEICIWLDKRKSKYLLVAVLGTLLMTLGLTRGGAVSGMLIAVGIYVARRHKAFVSLYWLFVILLTCFGSVSYYILFLFFGLKSGGYYDATSIATLIASGAPDLNDMLNFTSRFLASPEYTYGRTFVGGLVPNHYYWNPGVWTLHIVSPDTDLSEIISGGLRLPISHWGYIAFGWTGAFLVPLIAGFFQGSAIAYIKQCLAQAKSNAGICMAVLMYMNVFMMLYSFYDLLLYWVPPVIVLLMICRKTHIRWSHAFPQNIEL
jgi:hypothetical protein